MSEVNIRMIRGTYINRIRSNLEDVETALVRVREAIDTFQRELDARPNAPEGWVKEEEMK